MPEVQEISLPEVQAFGQTPRFYRDENGRDMVEISFVGDGGTTNIKKVTPKHMADFRDAWNLYCDGTPPQQRKGTALTDVEGINDLRAEQFIKANIHTAEELQALSDAQCQGVGHGTLTCRENAKKLLALRSVERADATVKQMSAAAASMKAGPQSAEIETLKNDVAELKGMLGDVLKALADKPKRGRPAKAKSE